MSGLYKIQNNVIEEFQYSNGAPKEGTTGYYYLEGLKKDLENKIILEGNIAYLEGIKFALDDMFKRLKPLVYMQFEELDSLDPLPEYANDLKNILTCLTKYSKGLSTQVNNNNPTNFKEGTRTLLLQAERIMGEKKGDIINQLLPVTVKPIKETRGNKVGMFVGQGRPRVNPIKPKKEKPAIIPDPADTLINVKLNTEQ